MRALTYYVAASLDGYIAGPDGQYDFFPFEGELADAVLAEFPETIPAHARAPLGVAGAPAKHFDTVIMGRGTYEPARQVGITSPYSHLEQYVVSRTLASPDPDVHVVADDPAALVRELKEREGMGIWLAGGGIMAGVLRDEIDELIIKRNPAVIGSGIPLFAGAFAPTSFVRSRSTTFDSGTDITTYVRA